MQYLCIAFLDENVLTSLSPAEGQALNDESLAYDKALKAKGHFVSAGVLEPVRSGASVRVRDGKALVTDGPFAETREQIGGFILIEAADFKEAIQIASGIPVARLGGIEVRPLHPLTQSTGRLPSEEKS